MSTARGTEMMLKPGGQQGTPAPDPAEAPFLAQLRKWVGGASRGALLSSPVRAGKQAWLNRQPRDQALAMRWENPRPQTTYEYLSRPAIRQQEPWCDVGDVEICALPRVR